LIEDLVILRAIEEDELSFVYHSWLTSLRSGSPYHRSIPKTQYYDGQKRILYRVLDRSNTIVATPKDHPNIIAGYIVWEPSDPAVIHYIYVKSDFRKMGLGALFVEVASAGNKITGTHRTTDVKGKDFLFNPYLLGETDGEEKGK
jgi:ribosomal protein S18 acetylase RimI-like enzyme